MTMVASGKPTVAVQALLMSEGRVLLGRRGAFRPPFAGQWVLPGLPLADRETAEDCLARVVSAELGSEALESEFRDTLYLEDVASRTRHVWNVFQVLRWDGKLRFRARGEFEDVRWVPPDELSTLPLPAPLRVWLRERLTPADAPPPDNREAWESIADAYQEKFAPPADDVYWGVLAPPESELRLLGDVRDLRTLVLGCGGGQDAVALARWGAQVTGVDFAEAQLAHARKLAAREGQTVAFLKADITDLPQLEDESFDVAMAAHTLEFVERIESCLGEVARLLNPGGRFVFSVQHPVDACLNDEAPHYLSKPYFQVEHERRWDFPERGVSGRFRFWSRPIAVWFELLTAAGFEVERLLEPEPVAAPRPWERAWGDADLEKTKAVPSTLIIAARRIGT